VILILAVLLIIAVLFIYHSGKFFDQKIRELDKKFLIQTSVNNDLERAQLRFQQLSINLEGELHFWKKRRTSIPKVVKNTRKKKVRGKGRKGRK
jgi:hypothetical protein